MIFTDFYWSSPYFLSSIREKEVKQVSFQTLSTLDELAQTLTVEDCHLDQWIEWKREIKDFVSKQTDLQALDRFFTTLTEWGMKKNPQKTMAILVDIVTLDILRQVVAAKQKESEHPFTSLFELATRDVSQCPILPDTSFHGRVRAEWKRFRPVIIYFIPNLLNIFLGAFNFLDSHKKFTTLWDKHLLLEIIYKFFLIPYCLVQVLQPRLIVPAKVYCVAALIIVASGILISCYHRWFKLVPDEVVNCTNLDKQMEVGEIELKVGQEEEMGRLIAALEAHDNVLLTGYAGEGKTALVHRFIQLKHEGKLPEALQKLTVFEVDCGMMNSNLSFGHSELINQIRDQIKGHEDRVLLFFDDFHQLATKEEAFFAFKKRFVGDTPHCKCILATTLKKWENLKELDSDYSFQSRTYQIKIASSSDEQIRNIITNYYLHFARDVPVTKDSIDRVVALSSENDYLPESGRAAKAEILFKTAIGRCRAALDHPSCKPVKKVKNLIAHQQKINESFYRLSHLLVKGMKRKQAKRQKEESLELADLDGAERKGGKPGELKEKLILEKLMSPQEQIFYLWYCFYAQKTLENVLKEEIQKVHSDILVQVDSALIQQVYEEIKA